MERYTKDAKNIEGFIDTATPERAQAACKMLDDFWRTHCEVNVKILWIVGYTRHNHGAKGAWARLDHKLRLKLKEWGII